MDPTTPPDLLALDLVEIDREYRARRAMLVGQRFAAGLHHALLQNPLVEEVFLDFRVSQLKRSVRPVAWVQDAADLRQAVVDGRLTADQATIARGFQKAMGPTHQALGTSSETVEALREVFAHAGEERWARGEALAACEVLMRHPLTQFTPARRAELAASLLDERAQPATAPRQGPRL